MKLAVVRYNAGNTQSVRFALNRLGVDPILTNDPEILSSADKVIFPGVGEASTTMAHLKEKNLDKILPALKQPFLGICLGMQLMCSYSEEGDTDCLGIFDLDVKRFTGDMKVPHMGWNTLKVVQNGVLDPSLEDKHFYFVHSYYVPESEFTTGLTEYGIKFSSAIRKDNFHAVQFHPEKSGPDGEQILKNFLAL